MKFLKLGMLYLNIEHIVTVDTAAIYIDGSDSIMIVMSQVIRDEGEIVARRYYFSHGSLEAQTILEWLKTINS